jgi:hypothetical protein
MTNDKLLISSALLADEFSLSVESKVICSSEVTLVESLSTVVTTGCNKFEWATMG